MRDVVERTLLVTRLRTTKNVIITIPNGAVVGAQIVNYTTLAGGLGLILHTEPAPFVLQTSLDDFYVSYELNAYTRAAGRMAFTYSALHANIQDAFNAAGVEIMSPHYAALRDGNVTTIPADQLPRDYTAPGFRVELPGRAP